MSLFNRYPIHEERRVSVNAPSIRKEALGFIPYQDYPKYFNTLQSDGRVNSGYDHVGNILAISVPPYIPNFIQNIDPPIRPLIRALTDKNYMPISSCAGHGIWDTRYIRLCFNYPPMVDQITHLLRKIKGVTAKTELAVCNMEVKVVNGKILLNKVPLGRSPKDVQMGCDYLNYFFNRNSLEWVYLDIDIGGRIIEDGKSIKGASKIKKIIGSLFKERITKKLITLIKSDEFPFYPW